MEATRSKIIPKADRFRIGDWGLGMLKNYGYHSLRSCFKTPEPLPQSPQDTKFSLSFNIPLWFFGVLEASWQLLKQPLRPIKHT
jgi:hypothetical protein